MSCKVRCGQQVRNEHCEGAQLRSAYTDKMVERYGSENFVCGRQKLVQTTDTVVVASSDRHHALKSSSDDNRCSYQS